MFKSMMCCSVLVGATVLVGCKKDEAPETPVSVAPPIVAPAATQPSMPDVTPPPAPAMPATMPAMPDTAPAVMAPAAPAAPAVDAGSQSLLTEVEQDIKDKKWDDADSALKKLEAMKDKLPPDWLDKLKDLRTAITAGKAANGLKIPGL